MESRTVEIEIDDETGEFIDPGLSEPGDEFTVTLTGNDFLLNITSAYNGIREYAQLASVALPADEYPTATFAPTWGAGFSSDPTGEVTYANRAGVVTLFLEAALVGDSDTSAMTWAAGSIPIDIRPTAERSVYCTLQYNDTVEAQGQVRILADGSAIFNMHVVVDGRVHVDGVFQTGQDKGLADHWTVLYTI